MAKKKKISESLGTLMDLGDEMFSDPFATSNTEKDSAKLMEDNMNLLEIATTEFNQGAHTTGKKKKDKGSEFDKLLLGIDDTVQGIVSDSGWTFDAYLDNISIGGEIDDSSLKKELTALGRKFARQTAITGDESEIAKAFSPQEARLIIQLDEINGDLIAVQKDIDYIRGFRTRNYKALSELMQVKSQLQGTYLNTIKEINSSKKVQIDLKAKDKAKESQDNVSQVSARALKSLFSMNRKELNAAMEDETYCQSTYNDADNATDEAYYSSHCNDADDTDGDKFIKYENVGAHYVLITNEDSDVRQVITEDKDGNMIPDYPLPTDIDDLDFNINYQSKTATDQHHRNYSVRTLNVDGKEV